MLNFLLVISDLVNMSHQTDKIYSYKKHVLGTVS